MSLNLDMKLDLENACGMPSNVFDAFGMDSEQVNFSLNYPKKPREVIPLTIGMLVKSALPDNGAITYTEGTPVSY